MPQPALSKKRQIAYTLAPLLLLLLCLGIINLVPRQPLLTGVTATATLPGEPVFTVTPSPAQAGLTTPSSPTATATPLPTSTPTPLPTLPPTAVITLHGPPDGSVLSRQTPLSLFWSWPLSLTPDQYFAVYLQDGAEERLLGTLPEANMGSSYQWQLQPADLADLAETVAWQIRLESTLAATPLSQSALRSLRFMSNR